jgi:hypothetical protein
MAAADRRVTVDGELFAVSFEGRTLHASWLSGPVPDYGFSASPYDESSSDADLAEAIRTFLGQVGPDGVID